MSAEDRIREAARQLFLAKGYEGTTVRDLAETAGLNVALTNYYFRSKQELFRLTFADLHHKLFEQMTDVLNRAIPLQEKVALLIEGEFALVEENPDLPMFVLYELRHNPSLFANTTPPPYSLFFDQVREAVASGQLPDIQPAQLVMLIAANVHHPYMARPAITTMVGVSREDMTALLSRHKQTVKAMLMSYLFGTNNENV